MPITNTSRVLRYLPLAMGSYGSAAGAAGLAVGSTMPILPSEFRPASANFQASLYRDASGHYTVAIAGTNELGDWTDANRALATQNLAAALQTNTWDPQLSDAVRFVFESFREIRRIEQLENAPLSDLDDLRAMVDITGHSLGGALAELAGTFFGLSGVNIDGPGISALLNTPEYQALQTEIRTSFPELQASYPPTGEGILSVAYSVVGVTGTHVAGATVERAPAADAAEFAMTMATVGALTADPFLSIFAIGVLGATASQHGSGHILGQTEALAGLTALANPYSMFGVANGEPASAFSDLWDPAAPGSPTLAALRLQTITSAVQTNVAGGQSPMGITMDGTVQTRGPFSVLAFRDETTGRLVEVYTPTNARGEVVGPPLRREYVTDAAGHVGEFNAQGDVTLPWHDANGAVVGLLSVGTQGVVTATSLLGAQGQFQLTVEQADAMRLGQGNWNDTLPAAHPLADEDLYGRNPDGPSTYIADDGGDKNPDPFHEAVLDAFGNPVPPRRSPGTQLAENGGVMTDGGNQHAGRPDEQPLPTFTDYLTATHLTPAQETALAAELDRQHLGGNSGIGFVSLPDGSVMLQNTDGDVVGQLNVEADGTVRWSGIGGERSYIRPGGMVQDQHTVDQTAAAAIDERNATQTATAAGLLNAIVGLQSWESMNDLQRAAAALAIYNIVDNLNGGQLPGQLGSIASALGLFSALERGDVGGAVYSGLNLVENLTASGPGTGLVSQNLGGNFLPALGMVLAIQSGDPAAMVSSGLSLMSSLGMIGPWGAAAAVVITLLSTILADTDMPTREGLAHARWGPDGQLQIVTDLDTEGGGASAAGWMRGMAEGLQARLAGSGSSLVPGLLPAIGYRLDPDAAGPAHGAPGFVYLEWIDAQGRSQTRYYDSEGNRNDGSGETLGGDFLQHAAAAIAPDWVVATALAHWQHDTTQRPQLPDAAMPDIDTDGLHQTLHALVLGGLAEARAAQLDTDADGFVERSQWLAVQQAALALDSDGNGTINAGELVDTRGGDRTDLDWLDANRDGVIDNRDPAFGALRLWVDTNADGRSSPDATDATDPVAVETRTLAQAGIVAIDFRTDPPTAVHADGRREIFGAQGYVGDVLGNRYDRVAGGVLQGMEQADGSAVFQLLAANTRAFDGQAAHMHAGENLGGGASAVEAGDKRLVSTSANTTASTHRRTGTTLATGDRRIAGGATGTTRNGQAPALLPANVGATAAVRNSGERGIVVLFADAATGTGAALRDATAAMVRSADGGTLAGGGGAGLLGVLAAGMAAWPALADAGQVQPVAIAGAGIVPAADASDPVDHATSAVSATGPVETVFAFPRNEYGNFSHMQSAFRGVAGITGLAGGTDAPAPLNGGAAGLFLRPNADAPAGQFDPSNAGAPQPASGDGSPDRHAAAESRPTSPASVAVQYVRPDVTAEAVTGAEDTKLRWSAASLLANDHGRNTLAPGSAGLHIGAVFAPRHGSVSLQADASGAMQVVFVPHADYHGEAGFSYTVADAFGLESRAEMSLQITPVNDAPVTRDETASADEDQPLYFRAADLLANDQDADSAVDGDALRITRVGAAAHGQVFLQPDGVVRFLPDANFHGPASFTYWVADRDAEAVAQGAGMETAAIAHLTVLPVNDLPVATGEALDSREDLALRIALGLLLGNDSDVDAATDGQRLSITAVGDARHGSVSLQADGSILFLPEADFFGAASFRYTVDDGAGGRADATAVVQLAPVNDAPAVLGETLAFDEDQAQAITQASLLANDSDVDNPASDLRIVAVEHAEHGQVRLEPSGNIVFVPDADYFGPAAFRYTVADGAGGFTVGRVALDISPVNDAPRLLGEQATLDEDEVARFSQAALLANDSDVDDPHAALVIVSVGEARHGSVALRNGEVVFTPDRDYHGAAGFGYTVSDGAGGSSDAWVDLSLRSVNDAPTVNGEWFTGKSGVAYTLSQAALLANDSDADGDGLRIVAVQGARHGTVLLMPDGGIRFVPEPGGSSTTGSFEYVVGDTNGARSTAVAQFDFSRLNLPPVATDDGFIGYEDIPLLISARQLLSNDTDADNTAAQLRLAGVDEATHGSVNLDADGNVRFVADADYSGAASFRYRVVDGDGGETYATAYLQLAAVNDAPVIEAIWYGRPIYGYAWENLPRQTADGRPVIDDYGVTVTDRTLLRVEGESQARDLLGGGSLFQSDGETVVVHIDAYRNGQLRPMGFDTDDAVGGGALAGIPFDDAYRQNGAIVAYDPDGDSNAITYGIASTPQHGHAWADWFVPNGSGEALDFTSLPDLGSPQRGAWQYSTVIGDLYDGADPFHIRVTDGAGASTLVAVDTWHVGAIRSNDFSPPAMAASNKAGMPVVEAGGDLPLPEAAAGFLVEQGEAVRLAMVFNQFMNTCAPIEMAGRAGLFNVDSPDASAWLTQGLVEAAAHGAAGVCGFREAA